jgi:hypothetical protein
MFRSVPSLRRDEQGISGAADLQPRFRRSPLEKRGLVP